MRNKALVAGAIGLLVAMVVGFIAMVIDVIVEAINVG
jgi:hypothetical protein